MVPRLAGDPDENRVDALDRGRLVRVSFDVRVATMTTARVWTVTSTTPTEDSARVIAKAVVAERLAAGAEIAGPAISVFWHLGELGEGSEWRVSLRTSAAVRDRLAARVSELHPWDSPEVTATPVAWCLDTYAEWVERTTAGQG